jgi:hypothetical protein
MKETFLELRITELERNLSAAVNGMRNALIELQDGDVDAAIETLQQFVTLPDSKG